MFYLCYSSCVCYVGFQQGVFHRVLILWLPALWWCLCVSYTYVDLSYIITVAWHQVFIKVGNDSSDWLIIYHELMPTIWWGGGLLYLGMVGRFRGDDSRFGDFQSDWVLILYLTTIRLTPSFCRKKSVYLSYLVSYILGPVMFNRFEAFCINFLLDFRSNWPPFSLVWNLFDPWFSHNLRSD